MERIYHGRLQDFRRGLTRLKFKGFCSFATGQEESAKQYCALIRSALDYRYRHSAGMAIPMTAKDLSLNPVFELKQSDRIPIGRRSHIDGKRLRELFVTMIYAGYLDRLVEYKGLTIKGNRMLIAYPEDDTGVDTAIFITPDAPLISDGKYTFRAIEGKSSLAFYIQVKEYYQYNDFQKAILYPKVFRVSNLSVARLGSYADLILIYVRSFCTINFKEVKADLTRHGLAGKNIVIIGTESLSTDSSGKLTNEYILWDFKQDSVFTTPIPVCDLFHTREEIEEIEKRRLSTAKNSERTGKGGEPDGAANGSQPIRSSTNGTSPAAGSRR
jgi:hypothetical protein